MFLELPGKAGDRLVFQLLVKVKQMIQKQSLWSREKWVLWAFSLAILLFVGAAVFISPKIAEAGTASSSIKTPQKSESSTAKSSTEQEFLLDKYKDPANVKKEKGTIATAFGSFFAVLKYIFYLALVLVLGYFAVLGIKIIMAKNNGFGGNSNDLINILEMRHLAPNKALCLVDVGERILLVGTGGANLEMISEFSDPEEVQTLRNKARTKGEVLQPFQNYLNIFTKNFLTSQKKTSLDNWKENLKTTTDSIQKKIVSLSELRKFKESSHNAVIVPKDDDNCSCPKCRLERILKAK